MARQGTWPVALARREGRPDRATFRDALSRSTGRRAERVEAASDPGTQGARIQGLRRVPDRNRSRRTRLACEIGVLLRYLFALVGEFRSRCRRGAAVELLVQTLTEVINTARQGFAMAAGIGAADALARAAKEQCLFDLEQLRLALSARLCLPSNELDHAMDALIVQFVCVDAERGKNLPRPRFSLGKPARRQ